jgi:hypothetical protein
MKPRFFEKLLIILVWLTWEVFGEVLDVKGQGTFRFSIRLSDGNIITGDNLEMKFEFGQTINATANPLDANGKPSKIQDGSAVFTLSASDVDGNDVADKFERIDDGTNELHGEWKQTGEPFECTGSIGLRADGDPDEGEDAPVSGSAAFTYDAPNTVSFDLALSAGTASSSGGSTGTPATATAEDSASADAVADVTDNV